MDIKNIFKKKKRHKMSFKEALDLTELPIVTFIIDGNKYNFILDTGCTISMINLATTKLIKNMEIVKDEIGTVFGLEGNEVSCKICKLKLNYRDIQYEEKFQVIDMSKSFDKIKKNDGVSVHGILGTRFFEKYKYKLDFKEMIAESQC